MVLLLRLVLFLCVCSRLLMPFGWFVVVWMVVGRSLVDCAYLIVVSCSVIVFLFVVVRLSWFDIVLVFGILCCCCLFLCDFIR